MKYNRLRKSVVGVVALAALATLAAPAIAQASKETLESISTPDKVETPIGTLEFLDSASLPDTAEK